MNDAAEQCGAVNDSPPTRSQDQTRVGMPFIAALTLANLGLWTSAFGPLPALLPLQVAQISPDAKEQMLGWVTGLGALVAIFANPLGGNWSDHTHSRWGQRLPWLVGGAVAGALCLVLLGQQHSIVGVIILWCLAQFSLFVMLAALNAEIPDRVPVEQRAICGAWVGVTQLLGAALGAALSTQSTVEQGYTIIAVLLLTGAALFPRLSRSTPLLTRLSPAEQVKVSPAAWWVDPRHHPDFAWAWCMRFVVNIGNTIGTIYLLYYLQDRLHYEQLFPGESVQDGLLVLVGLYAGGGLIGSLIGGWVSDRLGRRRIVIHASVAIMTTALLTMAFARNWHWVTVAAALEGIGYGAYVALDLALVSQVLPRPDHRGKDLGLVNIAISATQVIGPIIAAGLVTHLGGYTALYVVAAVTTLLGSVSVAAVRGVR